MKAWMATTIGAGIVGTFLLSACGNSPHVKTLKEQIEERETIVIAYNYPKGMCESSVTQTTLELAGSEAVILHETDDNSTSCKTYRRTNDGVHCKEQTLEAAEGVETATCVMAFDKAADSNSSDSNSSDSNSSDSNITII